MSSFQSAAAGIFQLLYKRPTAMNWTTFNLLDVGCDVRWRFIANLLHRQLNVMLMYSIHIAFLQGIMITLSYKNAE